MFSCHCLVKLIGKTPHQVQTFNVRCCSSGCPSYLEGMLPIHIHKTALLDFNKSLIRTPPSHSSCIMPRSCRNCWPVTHTHRLRLSKAEKNLVSWSHSILLVACPSLTCWLYLPWQLRKKNPFFSLITRFVGPSSVCLFSLVISESIGQF